MSITGIVSCVLKMMVKIKTAVLTIILSLLLFGVFLSLFSNSNLTFSVAQNQEASSTQSGLQSEKLHIDSHRLEKLLADQQHVIELRNNISRLLNTKQLELARLQCEVRQCQNCQ